jgi:glycosyltransferase involved in cell wall biosynthesis
MNIGFDAKRAFTNGTGLGHYSRTLIRSLSEYFPSNEYFLFTPKEGKLFSAEAANMHTVVPSSFPSTVFTSAWRSNWVKKDLKRMQIQLYHGLSHEIPVGIQKTGIRSVVTIHDLIFERYPEQYNVIDVRIYRSKFQYACKHSDKIVAISEQTKADIIQYYQIPEKKIEVCYQSCDDNFRVMQTEEEKLRVKKLYELPDQFFLYVGSVIERKNLLQICKGLNEIKNEINIPLVVIGDGGKYKQQVKEYISSVDLNDRIIFLGEKEAAQLSDFKSAKDFPAIYQQAVAMVYPSVFEGFGIPVLEALCSKIPVITSNLSCLPETGGDAAYYIDPYSTKDMADGLRAVANNHSLRQGLVEKGTVHAEKFSRINCAAHVSDVYKSVMQ